MPRRRTELVPVVPVEATPVPPRLFRFGFQITTPHATNEISVTAHHIDRVILGGKGVYRLYENGEQVAEFDQDAVTMWVRGEVPETKEGG